MNPSKTIFDTAALSAKDSTKDSHGLRDAIVSAITFIIERKILFVFCRKNNYAEQVSTVPTVPNLVVSGALTIIRPNVPRNRINFGVTGNFQPTGFM